MECEEVFSAADYDSIWAELDDLCALPMPSPLPGAYYNLPKDWLLIESFSYPAQPVFAHGNGGVGLQFYQPIWEALMDFMPGCLRYAIPPPFLGIFSNCTVTNAANGQRSSDPLECSFPPPPRYLKVLYLTYLQNNAVPFDVLFPAPNSHAYFAKVKDLKDMDAEEKDERIFAFLHQQIQESRYAGILVVELRSLMRKIRACPHIDEERRGSLCALWQEIALDSMYHFFAVSYQQRPENTAEETLFLKVVAAELSHYLEQAVAVISTLTSENETFGRQGLMTRLEEEPQERLKWMKRWLQVLCTMGTAYGERVNDMVHVCKTQISVLKKGKK